MGSTSLSTCAAITAEVGASAWQRRRPEPRSATVGRCRPRNHLHPSGPSADSAAFGPPTGARPGPRAASPLDRGAQGSERRVAHQRALQVPGRATASASCTSRSNRRRRAPCCATACCRSTAIWIRDERRAHRQRPRVLRHRAPPCTLDLAPNPIERRTTRGRHARGQRLRRTLRRHRAAGVLPAMHRKLCESVEALQAGR